MLNPHLSPEDDLYLKGQELRSIVNTRAWEIICETLKAIEDDADHSLRRLAPGDPGVIAAHGAVSGIAQCRALFLEAVQNAVDASLKAPRMQTPEPEIDPNPYF